MPSNEVDVNDLRALLSELNDVGGHLEDGEENRPYSRRARGQVGGTNILASGQLRSNNPGLKRKTSNTAAGFSFAGGPKGAEPTSPIGAPLAVRLAPLSGPKTGTPPPRGAMNALPALTGGAVSKVAKVMPIPQDYSLAPSLKMEPTTPTPEVKDHIEEIPSVPKGSGKRVPLPPKEQPGMVSRRPAPPNSVPDEYRESNFLPIMCARYLQPAGLTPPPRWGHTLTPVTGSQLLMFGGMEVHSTASKSSASLMVFHTNEISWEPAAVYGGEAPASRHSHSACAYEGHYLVIYGGMSTSDSGSALGDIHLYDVYTHEWRCVWSPGRDGSKKNEPAPRYGHTMVLRHHRLYIFGGRVKKSSTSTSFSLANNDIFVFSLSSGKWKKRIRSGGIPGDDKDALSPVPPPAKGGATVAPPAPIRSTTEVIAGPTPRAFHAACIKDSIMYIHGGGGAEGTVFNNTWCVDLNSSTAQWSCLHHGSTADAYARERHDIFVCGEGLLAVGGCSNTNQFSDRVAEKFNNFAAVLPISGTPLPAPNPCWIPVAMGNVSIVAPSKRSFAAAFSGGFVYVFGGQSGSEPATNSMIRFLAADGYTTTDARGTSEGNDVALRNVLMPLRESQTLPFDVYAAPTTFGAISGNHDLSTMVGLHRVVVQQRAPRFWEQLAACRSEALRSGIAGASAPRPASPSGGDAIDVLMKAPNRLTASSISGSGSTTDSGVVVHYTNGNKRVEGLQQVVTREELLALATYLYSGVLPSDFYVLLDEEDEDEGGAATAKLAKEKMKRELQVLQTLATAYDMATLHAVCDAYASGQRRAVEKAVMISTAKLRSDLLEMLRSEKNATVTVLFVDPHTKEQASHSLHPCVLMGASPFFADLLRPIYHGQKSQCQVGPVAAKITCTGPLLTSTSKRSVLVGPVSIPRLAVEPILRFLYSQELKAPKEAAYSTMLGAHQLDLPLLQGFCEAIVAREEVNYDSCCGFYHLSRKYQAFLLEEMSLLTAVLGYSTVRYTSGYKNLSDEDRHNIDDVANELGSSTWVPPPAPTNELQPPEHYSERWKGSAI